MRRRIPLAAQVALGGLVLVALGSCTVNMEHLRDPPRQTAFTTTGPWNSLVYLAATDSGVIAIDLGWSGNDRAFRRALAALGKEPRDLRHVFVTHSHRDHIAGWPWAREARFHLHEAEVPMFLGDTGHADWPSRAVAALKRTPRPTQDQIELAPFAADTTFDVGEPLQAFHVPGHTQGSVAYLFRGVLFMGDAVSHMPVRGFHGAATLYSDDMDAARTSLTTLLGERVDTADVAWVCTAHGKCSRPTAAFVEKVTR